MPIRRWLDSGEAYTVRYGMEMLMRYYLDDAFRPEYLEWVADVRSTEYYINMMRAWYFATALAKQPDAALPWLTEKRLSTNSALTLSILSSCILMCFCHCNHHSFPSKKCHRTA